MQTRLVPMLYLNSPWTWARTQVRFPSDSFFPLHSVCSKRLRVVQSAHDEDEGNLKTQICVGKRQYMREKQAAACLWMHLYTFIHWKRMYLHLYRGVGPVCSHEKKAPPFSTVISTTGLNAHLASAHVYIFYINTHPYIHKYSTHTVRSTADDWVEAEGRVDVRQCRFDDQSLNKFDKTMSLSF